MNEVYGDAAPSVGVSLTLATGGLPLDAYAGIGALFFDFYFRKVGQLLRHWASWRVA